MIHPRVSNVFEFWCVKVPSFVEVVYQPGKYCNMCFIAVVVLIVSVGTALSVASTLSLMIVSFAYVLNALVETILMVMVACAITMIFVGIVCWYGIKGLRPNNGRRGKRKKRKTARETQSTATRTKRAHDSPEQSVSIPLTTKCANQLGSGAWEEVGATDQREDDDARINAQDGSFATVPNSNGPSLMKCIPLSELPVLLPCLDESLAEQLVALSHDFDSRPPPPFNPEFKLSPTSDQRKVHPESFWKFYLWIPVGILLILVGYERPDPVFLLSHQAYHGRHRVMRKQDDDLKTLFVTQHHHASTTELWDRALIDYAVFAGLDSVGEWLYEIYFDEYASILLGVQEFVV